MPLEKPNYKVVMPHIIPPCTWEDVEHFQSQLLSDKMRAQYGALLGQKYGLEAMERLLDLKNIKETKYMLDNIPYLPASERYQSIRNEHGMIRVGDLLQTYI